MFTSFSPCIRSKQVHQKGHFRVSAAINLILSQKLISWMKLKEIYFPTFFYLDNSSLSFSLCIYIYIYIYLRIPLFLTHRVIKLKETCFTRLFLPCPPCHGTSCLNPFLLAYDWNKLTKTATLGHLLPLISFLTLSLSLCAKHPKETFQCSS